MHVNLFNLEIEALVNWTAGWILPCLFVIRMQMLWRLKTMWTIFHISLSFIFNYSQRHIHLFCWAQSNYLLISKTPFSQCNKNFSSVSSLYSEKPKIFPSCPWQESLERSLAIPSGKLPSLGWGWKYSSHGLCDLDKGAEYMPVKLLGNTKFGGPAEF